MCPAKAQHEPCTAPPPPSFWWRLAWFGLGSRGSFPPPLKNLRCGAGRLPLRGAGWPFGGAFGRLKEPGDERPDLICYHAVRYRYRCCHTGTVQYHSYQTATTPVQYHSYQTATGAIPEPVHNCCYSPWGTPRNPIGSRESPSPLASTQKHGLITVPPRRPRPRLVPGRRPGSLAG